MIGGGGLKSEKILYNNRKLAKNMALKISLKKKFAWKQDIESLQSSGDAWRHYRVRRVLDLNSSMLAVDKGMTTSTESTHIVLYSANMMSMLSKLFEAFGGQFW